MLRVAAASGEAEAEVRRTEKNAVTPNTSRPCTFRTSGAGANTQTAEMMRRLKEAEPTMVDGPRGSAAESKEKHTPTTFSRISGAEEPNAMRVRLATVAFQKYSFSPCAFCT